MLEIKDVRVVYPNGTEAIKSVSASIKQNEIVAIIGRSGAGKSTLLRAIDGMQKVTSGSIILDGEDITHMSKDQLREHWTRVGFIWQEYNLVLRLPAITNVLLGRLGHNRTLGSLLGYFSSDHREIALNSLDRMGMLHRAKSRADRLSGGEKQRVNIARAISQKPKLLLADEPVASLDPELKWQVMEDLARVAREEGVPTLINIHEVDLAKAFADRLIGIAQGVVVFDGPPSDLNQNEMDRIYRFDKEKTLQDPIEFPQEFMTIHEPEAVLEI